MASAEELRAAMRRFPSGIAVVTVDDEGKALGLTVASLVSLSLRPPLVAVSIGHQSSLHEPLRRAGRFVVNILSGEQDDLAAHFARNVPPIALWPLVPTREGGPGEPTIEGALAWIECRTAAEHEAGDHTIVVGEVLSVELGRPGPGLVYVEGRYRSL